MEVRIEKARQAGQRFERISMDAWMAAFHGHGESDDVVVVRGGVCWSLLVGGCCCYC